MLSATIKSNGASYDVVEATWNVFTVEDHQTKFAETLKGDEQWNTITFQSFDSGEFYATVQVTIKSDDGEETIQAESDIFTVLFDGEEIVSTNGYVTVNGTEEVFEANGLKVETTSRTTCDITLAQVNYHGMRFKDVKLSGVILKGDATNGYTFSGNNATISGANGTINGTAKNISGTAKMENGEWVMDLSAALTINWGEDDTEEATVDFSTTKPEEPEQPEQPEPDKPSTVTNRYHGSIIAKVVETVTENGETNDVTKSFDLSGTIDVIETSNDETVTVVIPAMQFDEVEWMDWSRAASTGEYNYNIPSLSVKGVTAVANASSTSYKCEAVEAEGTLADGSIAKYTVTINGSATVDGIMRMAIELTDLSTQKVINVSFANAANEGDVYDGKLTIDLAGSLITEGDGMDASINIIPSVDGTTATFLLPNFSIDLDGSPLPLGDIRVDDVEVTQNADGSSDYFGEMKGFELPQGLDTADITLNGSVDADGVADMVINIIWENTPITVHFKGDRTTTGIEAPGVDAGVVDGPAEYFTIGGVRVAGDHLAPGIYIERRGNQTRKILVK